MVGVVGVVYRNQGPWFVRNERGVSIASAFELEKSNLDSCSRRPFRRRQYGFGGFGSFENSRS